jgi:hypothetical protein
MAADQHPLAVDKRPVGKVIVLGQVGCGEVESRHGIEPEFIDRRGSRRRSRVTELR